MSQIPLQGGKVENELRDLLRSTTSAICSAVGCQRSSVGTVNVSECLNYPHVIEALTEASRKAELGYDMGPEDRQFKETLPYRKGALTSLWEAGFRASKTTHAHQIAVWVDLQLSDGETVLIQVLGTPYEFWNLKIETFQPVRRRTDTGSSFSQMTC